MIAGHLSEHGAVVLLSEAVQLCDATGERHTNGRAESPRGTGWNTAACYLACVQQEKKKEWKERERVGK